MCKETGVALDVVRLDLLIEVFEARVSDEPVGLKIAAMM
jgi:hypothetical protein